MSFTVWIPGEPRGKGSVRVGRHGAYKDAKTENYMAVATLAMQAARRGAPAIAEPTEVEIVVYVERPARLVPKVGPRVRTPQPPVGAFPAPALPDLDNVAKAILDSLTQAGVIVDDRRVVRLSMFKFYAAIGGEVGVRVTVAPTQGWSEVTR